jgi:beta-lactamase class A
MPSRGVKVLVLIAAAAGLGTAAYQLTPHPHGTPQALETALAAPVANPSSDQNPNQKPNQTASPTEAQRLAGLQIPQIPSLQEPRNTPTGIPARVTHPQPCLSENRQTMQLNAPAASKGLGGELALYVARFDPTSLQAIKAISLNSSTPFPLASTYKQSVLWTLLSQIDAGKIKWDEKFNITPADQSLGEYPYDHSSLRTLAERMIKRSDNTATDILHRRVGLEQPQLLADSLGLCQTRLLLPTKDWWTAQAGLDPNYFPPYGRLSGAEYFAKAPRDIQLKIAQSLDEHARTLEPSKLQHLLDAYFDGPNYNPKIDLQTQNASTALELAHLMAFEFMGGGLSPESRQAFEEIMHMGVGKGFLRTPFVKFGAKSGNAWRILTISGYIETPMGEHIIYVFLNQQSPQTYTVQARHLRAAFNWINRGIEVVQNDDWREIAASKGMTLEQYKVEVKQKALELKLKEIQDQKNQKDQKDQKVKAVLKDKPRVS